MRDAALMAEFCKSQRLFRACDCGGVVAKQGPSPRDVGEQLRSILEPRAADDSGRLPRSCKPLERRDDAIVPHAVGQTMVQPYIRFGGRRGVLIAEEIGDQRRVSAAPGGGGKRPPGRGCDQHGGRPKH